MSAPRGLRRSHRPDLAWRCGAVVLALICAVALVVLAAAGSAAADEPLAVRVLDANRDGRLDRAVIEGDFLGGRDRLTVYDPRNDLPASDDPAALVHLDHATLAFDAGSDGVFELVVKLESDGPRRLAHLYDDRDGDRKVLYRTDGLDLFVTESPYPTLRVESVGDWLRPDGRLSGAITILSDGVVPDGWAWQYPEPLVEKAILNDGKPDFRFETIDLDDDGHLDRAMVRLLAPASDLWGVFRAGLSAQAGSGSTAKPEGYLFWPLLDRPDHQWRGSYLASPPTVSLDWATARIIHFGTRGYPIEHGWHISSVRYVQDGVVNAANFENPMAYYDLAENHDGYPELHIRFAHSLPEDFCIYPGRCRQPWQEIRYSWSQSAGSNMTFDFKVGLAGRYGVEETVAFPSFLVKSVPHAHLPAWIVGREWDLASFVAVEGIAYHSTEGIYELAPTGEQGAVAYLLGLSSDPPADSLAGLRVGLRGEVTSDLRARPTLYLSAVDRKLHLRGATKGAWHLSESRWIQYESLGADQITLWRLVDGGQEEATLYHAAGHLVLSDADGVRIGRSEGPSVLYSSAPPTTHEDWLELGDALRRGGDPATPDDFAAAFGRLARESIHLSDASVSRLRLTDAGFRAVVHLSSSSRCVGDLALDGEPQAGGNALTFDGRILSIVPLTPPALAVKQISLPSPLPTGDRALVSVVVANSGLADADHLRVDFAAEPVDAAGGESVSLGSQGLAVRSGEEALLRHEVALSAPGRWLLRAEVIDPSAPGAPLAVGTAEISAREQPGLSLADLLAFGGFPALWAAPAVLVVLAAIWLRTSKEILG